MHVGPAPKRFDVSLQSGEPWSDRQYSWSSLSTTPSRGKSALGIPCQSLLDLDCELSRINTPNPQTKYFAPTEPNLDKGRDSRVGIGVRVSRSPIPDSRPVVSVPTQGPEPLTAEASNG